MTIEQTIAGTRTDHRPFAELRGGNLGVRVATAGGKVSELRWDGERVDETDAP